jgi:isocitrate dehydrogenase (NAD+)
LNKINDFIIEDGKYVISLIKGDGIGYEIIDSVLKIFDYIKVPIKFEEVFAGLDCYNKFGTPLPNETLESIKRNKIALKGPTTTPKGTGFKSVNVAIRKYLDLFANVRPSKTLPNISSKYNNLNLIVIRENIEDTYPAVEYYQTPDVVQTLRITSRQGSYMINKFAFELAKKLQRKRITCVHKANIHKFSDGMFLNTFYEISKDYPDFIVNDIIVDNLCMQLVKNPEVFDVLVLPNIFGDIVSDLCAGLVGSLGLAYSANIGLKYAVFEAVHGSAPDIANKNIANPTAIILASTYMLKYLNLNSYAYIIEQALFKNFENGIFTKDLNGNYSTTEFTEHLIKNIKNIDKQPFIDNDKDYNKNNNNQSKVNIENIPFLKDSKNWELIGVDIFIEWNNTDKLPDIPLEFNDLKLNFISNRATKIYPEKISDITLVNWYRCRYLANSNIDFDTIKELMDNFVKKGIRISQIELLYKEGNQNMFSEE